MNSWRILHGDVRDKLRELPSGSVQTCVTSPPYWGLRDYGVQPSPWGGEPECAHEWGDELRAPWANSVSGPNGVDKNTAKNWTKVSGQFCQRCGAWFGALGLEPTPDLFVEHLVEVFREAWRVLRPDGTLWLNLGDCYATGAGKVGDCPGGGEQGDRWREGRRPVENGHGIEQRPRGYKGDRNGAEGKHHYRIGPMTQPNRLPLPGLKPKDLVGVPWRVAFALQADGWYLRSDIIWAKPNPMPESVTDRPTKAHEYIFLLSKSAAYYYDADAIAEPLAECSLRRYQHAVDTNEKFDPSRHKSANGVQSPMEVLTRAAAGVIERGTRNKRTVWTVATQSYDGAHFATFPPDLIEPCILAGSRVGDTVLDPFNGSGTTGAVAIRHQRNYVGIELNADYIELARKRIGAVAPLFAEEVA